MFARRTWILVLAWLATCLLASSCGGGEGGDSGQAHSGGRVERAFARAADRFKVPQRFLTAVAYVESRMDPKEASAMFLNEPLAVPLGQSAFGIERGELGLSQGREGDQFEAQIEAYARWVSRKLAGLRLNPDPQSVEDRFNWVWELARLHRSSELGTRNVRVLFARELMLVLNEGFNWQDPSTGELLKLEAEKEAYSLSSFPYRLQTKRARIFSAVHLRLGSREDEVREQNPRGVEVVHCPLSLSACIEIQGQQLGEGPRLGAHYVIPTRGGVTDFPLQLWDHKASLPRTASNGETSYSDRVVIMLTGQSGKIVGGERHMVNPIWFTSWQLQSLGEVVGEVCDRLASEDWPEGEELAWKDCAMVNSGVKIQTTQLGAPYTWGDVVDYDADVFAAYIRSPGGLSGVASFEFESQERVFEEGIIKSKLKFPLGAKYVEFQRLLRCGDSGITQWSRILRLGVDSLNELELPLYLRDGGPNGDGAHFLRAKVEGNNEELLGWTTSRIYLKSFSEDDKGDTADCPKT